MRRNEVSEWDHIVGTTNKGKEGGREERKNVKKRKGRGGQGERGKREETFQVPLKKWVKADECFCAGISSYLVPSATCRCLQISGFGPPFFFLLLKNNVMLSRVCSFAASQSNKQNSEDIMDFISPKACDLHNWSGGHQDTHTWGEWSDSKPLGRLLFTSPPLRRNIDEIFLGHCIWHFQAW